MRDLASSVTASTALQELAIATPMSSGDRRLGLGVVDDGPAHRDLDVPPLGLGGSSETSSETTAVHRLTSEFESRTPRG